MLTHLPDTSGTHRKYPRGHRLKTKEHQNLAYVSSLIDDGVINQYMTAEEVNNALQQLQEPQIKVCEIVTIYNENFKLI